MKPDDAAGTVFLNDEVLQQIRHAAASERAAGGHEDKYSNAMKTAGASMYAAFRAAMLEQPDYKGRKVDEHVVKRVYESTKPRPWWDSYLVAARFADEKGLAKRDDARRLIQWHLDPAGAATRRAQRQLQQAAAQKVLRERRVSASRGMTSSHDKAPTTAEMRELDVAFGFVDGGARDGLGANAADVSTEDLLGEVNRLQSAAKKVEPSRRGDALEALRAAAREIERYVP